MQDVIDDFRQSIREAAAAGASLRIRGGGTKDFYGEPPAGEVLDTRPCNGIVHYEPTELVMTVRAGTPLAEVEAALAERGQMLAFEPPHFGEGATIGGAVAAGLAGPRRPFAGAVRDFVLGVRLLDGEAREGRFGGEVMKNVAGYDVSRLMAGALGTLGLILDVSLKVLPRPVAESSVRLELPETEAIGRANRWIGQALPISATCYAGGELSLRLSGAESAVRQAAQVIGGEALADADAFWTSVREQTHPFFAGAGTLWRLSVKSTTPPLPGRQLLEWGGALRWLAGEQDAGMVRAAAQQAGGHATLFRAADKSAGAFHPLAPALLAIHQGLKKNFDPHGVFNVGRMYRDF